jgi:molybdopterin-guanine dinucleotide biosynthesis protein A
MTPPAPHAVSGIVLAGGRSSRFGSDKLVARVDGERLLDRSVAALGEVVTEILVVSEPGATRELPTGVAVPLRVVADPEPFGGPLVGLLAGLEAAREPLVVVVGGDMPGIVPDVLRLLIGRLVADDGRAAATLQSRGRSAPLPLALRTGAATDAARRLLGDDERRLRAIVERLATVVIDERDWRPLDPAGETLRDVDEPGDLRQRRDLPRP